MNLSPKETFHGQDAIEELDIIQTAISEGPGVVWAMPYGFGNEHCYKVANIALSPRNAEFTELTVYEDADESATKLIPCHSTYNHKELVVERFEMDGKAWWKLNEIFDAGYFDLLVFVVNEGVDPSTFFCSEAQAPEPRNLVESVAFEV